MMRRTDRTLTRSSGASGLAEPRERQRKSRELELRKKKLGDPEPLRDDGEPAEAPDGIMAVSEAIAEIGESRKRKNRLQGQELDEWKARRERVRQIRVRQADGKNLRGRVRHRRAGDRAARMAQKQAHDFTQRGSVC